MYTNDITKQVKAGCVAIGGGAPVSIQSMLSVRSDNIDGNVEQAKALETAGCEIIRVSVPNMNAVRLVSALKENLSVPIVADICIFRPLKRRRRTYAACRMI